MLWPHTGKYLLLSFIKVLFSLFVSTSMWTKYSHLFWHMSYIYTAMNLHIFHSNLLYVF
jgi:hypothetical protein